MGLTGDKTDVFDNNWVSRFNKKIDNIVQRNVKLQIGKIIKKIVNVNFCYIN